MFAFASHTLITLGGILLVFFSIKSISVPALQRLDNHRFEMGGKFLSLALDRQIFGYGDRINFAVHFSNGKIKSQAHNIILNGQIYGGLFASLSLIAILTLGIYYASFYYIKFYQPLPLIMVVLPLIAGIVYFKIEIITAGWHWIVFWLPVAMCIGAEFKVRKSNLYA